MRAAPCTVQVRLPRPLFRKLAARAIEERTDVSSVIVRAVLSELPKDYLRPNRGRRPHLRLTS